MEVIVIIARVILQSRASGKVNMSIIHKTEQTRGPLAGSADLGWVAPYLGISYHWLIETVWDPVPGELDSIPLLPILWQAGPNVFPHVIGRGISKLVLPHIFQVSA